MKISKKVNKKSFLLPVVMICIVITLVSLGGCNKCVDKQATTVNVTIVNEFYEPQKTYHRYSASLDRYVSETRWAEYEITVEYDRVWYSLRDENTYRKYHGKIGEIVKATLVTKKFEDGSVKKNITELIGG